MTTANTHQSQRISMARLPRPLNDLSNSIEALQTALIEAQARGASDREVAELAWLAGRAHTEALGELAKRLDVGIDDLSDAIANPDESPDLAARVDALCEGIVRWL